MTTFFFGHGKEKTLADLVHAKIKETELDLFKVLLDKESAMAWEAELTVRLQRLKLQQTEMQAQK